MVINYFIMDFFYYNQEIMLVQIALKDSPTAVEIHNFPQPS